MSGCCDETCVLDARQESQRGTLQRVLGINAVMFLLIMAAALYGDSTRIGKITGLLPPDREHAQRLGIAQ